MRQGELSSLYRATNAIILGDRLADKLAAKCRRQCYIADANAASTARSSACSIPASGRWTIDRPMC